MANKWSNTTEIIDSVHHDVGDNQRGFNNRIVRQYSGDRYSRIPNVNQANLWGLDFLDVVLKYTTSFEPLEVKSILNATSTESVAACNADRYAESANGDAFECRVYEANNCGENEDIDFRPDDPVCVDSSMSYSYSRGHGRE